MRTILLVSILLCCMCQPKTQQEQQVAEKPTIYKKVDTEELKALMVKDDLQLIDVRTPVEIRENGKIEGALEINYVEDDFKDNLNKLDPNKPVAVYCAAGGRSAKAAAILQKMGFTEIYDYGLGYSGWVRGH